MSRKSLRTALRIISRVPGLYTGLAFLLARRATVQGLSMAPTLLPGERLLFDRLAYVRDRPRLDDIVLVTHPLRRDLRMVKRLTGVPRDAIDGHTRGRGEYWVLGDNDALSTDSREFGPVRRHDLLGRAWIRYWPTDLWRVFES
jgi:signal peptidase I